MNSTIGAMDLVRIQLNLLARSLGLGEAAGANPLMKKTRLFTILACAGLAWPALAATPTTISAADWPTWRGPTRDGIAAPGQNPPVQWSETENILWKVPVPGRGHGSPTVAGD